MPDMNAEFYSCCGHGVEISGHTVEGAEGQRGHRVHCKLCDGVFIVPGDLQAARDAIPTHFRETHQLVGPLAAPIISQM